MIRMDKTTLKKHIFDEILGLKNIKGYPKEIKEETAWRYNSPGFFLDIVEFRNRISKVMVLVLEIKEVRVSKGGLEKDKEIKAVNDILVVGVSSGKKGLFLFLWIFWAKMFHYLFIKFVVLNNKILEEDSLLLWYINCFQTPAVNPLKVNLASVPTVL